MTKESEEQKQKRKEIESEYEKYCTLWIESEPLNKQSYFGFIEYLLLMEDWKRIKALWTKWIQQLMTERENETDCLKQKRIGSVLSALYQHYGRISTQKYWNEKKRYKKENDDEKDSMTEFDADGVIKGYFLKSLEFDDRNIAAFQGLAAYHITKQQPLEALSVLKRGRETDSSSADLWTQYATLCQDVAVKYEEEEVPHCIEVLEEGMECITNTEYDDHQQRTSNITKMAQTLVEKLILFQGADSKNRDLAAKYCWMILDELDALNVSALRNISKVSDDRERITLCFESILSEHPMYCPALIEYAQFLTTAKKERVVMLQKAEGMLLRVTEITKDDVKGDNSGDDGMKRKHRCVALYLLGFVKMHQMERGSKVNESLRDEARKYFISAVDTDGDNLYARINLAQFLAFKDNENEEALLHLEYAHRNLDDHEPNLIANLVKVLAKKAIEEITNIEEEDLKKEDIDKIDIKSLERAFKLCGDGLKQFTGHFGLIVARSSLQNIKRKFGLMQLDDGLNEEEIEKLKNPQTTYGMVGVDIMNPQDVINKESK